MPYGYRGLKIFTSLSLRFQDFQRKLLADPKFVLAEEGYILPEGKTIKIIEGVEYEHIFLIPHDDLELKVKERDIIATPRIHPLPEDFF